MKIDNRSWKKLSGKIVYKNPWIKLHEDIVLRPDGKEGIYGYLEKPLGVFIVPFDEKKRSIYLVQQNRYPIKKTIIDLPAGVVTDNNYLANAQRELLEETGMTAEKWEHLGGFFVAPGHESTRMETFLASQLNTADKKITGQDGDELIKKIVEIPLVDLKKMIISGNIECGISLAALNLFLNKVIYK